MSGSCEVLVWYYQVHAVRLLTKGRGGEKNLLLLLMPGLQTKDQSQQGSQYCSIILND